KRLEVGAHCRPWNRCRIGICYEGGLDADGRQADTRTPEQTEQFILLLMRMVKIFPCVRIRGHRDMPGSIPKAC
ncbi:N-acetylmuramoyl-L-alanine amidase, partial [Phocaeicola vulgatus]|nr:N-acetylmuramoyl-L-alanine amidase [Phocaeicola vulgatus]